MGGRRVAVLVASGVLLAGVLSHAASAGGDGVREAVPTQGLDAGLGGDGVTAAQAGDFDVEVVDNAFEPREFSTRAGPDGTATVTWAQTGSNPHTVTADDGQFDSHPDCPPNFSACMAEGDTYESDPLPPGTYPYYCKIHGEPGGEGMAGVLVISESSAPTTTTAPAAGGDAGRDTGGTAPQAAETPEGTAPAPVATPEADVAGSALPATGVPGPVGATGTLLLAAAWLARRLRG